MILSTCPTDPSIFGKKRCTMYFQGAVSTRPAQTTSHIARGKAEPAAVMAQPCVCLHLHLHLP